MVLYINSSGEGAGSEALRYLQSTSPKISFLQSSILSCLAQQSILMGPSGTFSSTLPRKRLTKGWFMIYAAVGLFLGSTWKMPYSRSTMWLSLVFKSQRILLRSFISMFSMRFKESLFLRKSRSAVSGLPVTQNIFQSWEMVELPLKIGFSITISANTHPILHTSISFPQLLEPSRIYGARYHLVVTSSVRTSSSPGESFLIERMSPKSQSFTSQVSLTRILEGLMSLWTRSAAWRYARVFASWQKIKCL